MLPPLRLLALLSLATAAAGRGLRSAPDQSKKCNAGACWEEAIQVRPPPLPPPPLSASLASGASSVVPTPPRRAWEWRPRTRFSGRGVASAPAPAAPMAPLSSAALSLRGCEGRPAAPSTARGATAERRGVAPAGASRLWHRRRLSATVTVTVLRGLRAGDDRADANGALLWQRRRPRAPPTKERAFQLPFLRAVSVRSKHSASPQQHPDEDMVQGAFTAHEAVAKGTSTATTPWSRARPRRTRPSTILSPRRTRPVPSPRPQWMMPWPRTGE